MPPSLQMYLVLGILTVILVIIVATHFATKGSAGNKEDAASKVKRRALLTSNESEFFHRLTAALPNHRVLAQVSMGALLEPTVPRTSKEYMSIRGRFSQKVVDYVICSPTLDVVALVELDDRTHSATKDALRDKMLASAGYKVIRFDSRAKPSVEQIQQMLA